MAVIQALMRNNKLKNCHISLLTTVSNYASFAKLLEYRKCYKTLGIDENNDQEEIRKAYLKLAKKYHPDSGTKEADADKFAEIDKAFKVLINKKSRERWNVDEDISVQEQDIKHTAPQHRQYLSYEGIGVGTPSQRQKQYTKIRAIQAAENVLQHRISKVSAEEGALLAKTPLKHKIKTKYGFERLVEDLIQESMSKGEFNNLSGTGKPLQSQHNRNPFVDLVTHKLNEVLIDNGFTPEWIMLQKEIREDLQKLRDSLSAKRSRLGPNPLTGDDSAQWADIVFTHQELVEQINNRIKKFNLVVPILDKQMIMIDLEKEAQKALTNGKHSQSANQESSDEYEAKDVMGVFSLIESFLFKKG